MRLYVSIGGSFTKDRAKAKHEFMTEGQITAAKRWARMRGYKLRSSRVNPYPWLSLDSDTEFPCPELANKLNELGKRLGKRLHINEGTRTPERQRELYAQFEARGFTPPLVAKPGTSRHETGLAADVQILSFNIGLWPGARTQMQRLGLCLPVSGEPWHVEMGNTWKA